MAASPEKNGHDQESYYGFAILTTSWILGGGLLQFCIVLFLLCCHRSEIQDLPKSLQILLLLTSPILLAPVIVYLYGLYIVARAKDKPMQDDVIR